ncbi:MAG: phosphoglycerate kinase [Candidatus Saccharimonadia bacterium]
MAYKTVRDLDVANKAVVVRVDYNVPVKDGVVGDTLRIEASFETIRYLLEKGCRLILLSHLGEPKTNDRSLSLRPVASKAAELLGVPIGFIGDCVGQEVRHAISTLQTGQIIMLENLRFNPGETANDEQFARTLASYGEVYVDDAFAVIHRAHASLVGIPKYLPSGIGFLVEREVNTIFSALESPKRPLLAVIGGVKISTKAPILNNLLPKVDNLLIGGAMANTFLAASGLEVGKSLVEVDQQSLASEIISAAKAKGKTLIIPTDVVVSVAIDGSQPTRVAPSTGVSPTEHIVDIGPETIEQALALIEGGTVIWNGPLGITEVPQFAAGTRKLADGIVSSGAFSLIGGGDTADYIDGAGLHNSFSFVSTGGGASLDLMSGKPLPGLVAIETGVERALGTS